MSPDQDLVITAEGIQLEERIDQKSPPIEDMVIDVMIVTIEGIKSISLKNIVIMRMKKRNEVGLEAEAEERGGVSLHLIGIIGKGIC